MATTDVIRFGRFEYTPAELDQMFEEATRRGEANLRLFPLAVSAKYERQSQSVVLTLNNGARYEFPADLLQGVADARETQRAKIRIFGPGTSVDWPSVDMQFETINLLVGRFGNSKWMQELRRQRKVGQPVATLQRKVRRGGGGTNSGVKQSLTATTRGGKRPAPRTRRVAAAWH
ncbi:MAG TPA: DUF2442 domain-containing protein [Planctomycetaceae bacterium]|nr:DUF2442 domain-containing protein [Planctomycetaceae bacterium]